MATFEFVIPLTIDALKEAFSQKQYAVTHIFSSKEIPSKLSGKFCFRIIVHCSYYFKFFLTIMWIFNLQKLFKLLNKLDYSLY